MTTMSDEVPNDAQALALMWSAAEDAYRDERVVPRSDYVAEGIIKTIRRTGGRFEIGQEILDMLDGDDDA